METQTQTQFDAMVFTLLLPVLGALLIGTSGRRLGKKGSALIGSTAVGLSFLIVLSRVIDVLLNGAQRVTKVVLWEWMAMPRGSGSFSVDFGLLIDPLSLTLMSVVTGVGFLIHWYSSEYMAEDPEMVRFFALLNVFIAAMTMLVLASNFATLIIGWGGVGFASFALIGFWRHKPSAAAAAKKAFVMNVVGDVGLMATVFILYWKAGTLDYLTVFNEVLPSLPRGPETESWLILACIGLMVGAYAKSAQLPLHTWLPDAMEGPTPVSALIHAATMVTAGVYLLVRCAPMLALVPSVGATIAGLGVLTAFFAACCALTQTDLKRVLAYSTMSQLGYMFCAVGVGAYGAAIFHLMTHAFFKALLFLCAGIVIHAAHGEQDMRKLGGLHKPMTVTSLMFAVGGACLAGLPLTSGFFSKEAILHAAHGEQGSTVLFAAGALVALMTAFYTGRAYFMTFFGPLTIKDLHLPGGATTLSCLVLAALSLGFGAGYAPLGYFLAPNNVLEDANRLGGFAIEPGVTSMPALGLSALVLIAVGIAWAMYGKGQEDKLGAEKGVPDYLRSGMRFDTIYGHFAGAVARCGKLFARVVDRFFLETLPGLVGRSVNALGQALRETQTGQTRHYMVSVMVSVLVLLLYSLFVFGGSQS